MPNNVSHSRCEQTYANMLPSNLNLDGIYSAYGNSNLDPYASSQNALNTNAYSTQPSYATYGTVNSQRQYSETSEGLYHEIPENLYSQVPEETLKPHRPAPTKPGSLLGQPLSMQQIQRKIQQGQVSIECCF